MITKEELANVIMTVAMEENLKIWGLYTLLVAALWIAGVTDYKGALIGLAAIILTGYNTGRKIKKGIQ